MKILTVVGARPQFVKAAAVSARLRQRHEEVLLHTGQHYDEAMSDRFFRELALPAPEVTLGVGSGSHGAQTARMLEGIEAAIVREQPDAVLVYGDTNSTLAGALAAAKLHVPVAHVEAGLRSYNRRMPEELNRVVVDQLSAWLFCPSDSAAANLRREGIDRGIHVVGDVMAAVLEQTRARVDAATVAEAFGVRPGDYAIATVHRADNTDDDRRLLAIVSALSAMEMPVVLPAHPRLTAALARSGAAANGNLRVVDPLGYPAMVALVSGAAMVLTDSGGLQKEAYWLGVPCVTLREETEWVETVAAGWNTLAGADPQRIAAAARAAVSRPAARPPLYGGDEVVARMLDVLDRGTEAA